MPTFEQQLEDDIIDFGQRMNARPAEPSPPKQSLQTEIYQLNPEQSRRFLELNDAQLGFTILRDGVSNGLGN